MISRLCLSQVKSTTVFPSVQFGKTVTIRSALRGLPVVEPHLAAHPYDPNHLLAAAMVITSTDQPYESARLSSFVSQDGGKTWNETLHNFWGYDPWTSISEDGQAVLTWLGTEGSFQNRFPIQFFYSNDGGIGWQGRQTIDSDHGHDGTKVIASGKDFYFTSVRFNDDMSADVVLFHRRNYGIFEEVAKVSGEGIRLNFCEPAILSDGSVIVPSSHYLRKAWVQRYDPKLMTLSKKSIITIRPGGQRGYMRMASDTHTNSPFSDRLYFARAANGVWLNFSTDQGKSWSKDIRVDQFENQLPSKALVTSLAINRDGLLAISWRDSQNDPNQDKYDTYFVYSKDGGASFSLPIRISTVSTNPRILDNGDVANKFPGGGHYINLVAKSNGSFQVIWSDSRSGYFELQTCEITIQ
ncbi:MAG: sialidase family protein [Reichenbachiella sp.]|uniref:sialidase family protein n=1 Tax=Reichenbachiella sp. TaxID=2184521 RepID=UPI00326683D2